MQLTSFSLSRQGCQTHGGRAWTRVQLHGQRAAVQRSLLTVSDGDDERVLCERVLFSLDQLALSRGAPGALFYNNTCFGMSSEAEDEMSLKIDEGPVDDDGEPVAAAERSAADPAVADVASTSELQWWPFRNKMIGKLSTFVQFILLLRLSNWRILVLTRSGWEEIGAGNMGWQCKCGYGTYTNGM